MMTNLSQRLRQLETAAGAAREAGLSTAEAREAAGRVCGDGSGPLVLPDDASDFERTLYEQLSAMDAATGGPCGFHSTRDTK
jgi:hypothetical protein